MKTWLKMRLTAGSSCALVCRHFRKNILSSGMCAAMGLMIATEFTRDGKPDKDTAKAVQQACLARDLLLLTCGTYDNVIRWIPPLIVTEAQIEEARTFSRGSQRNAA